MKPSGHAAVMADRARGEVAADDPRQALWRKLEFFPSPPWSARAGAELITALDPGRWWCWEPACGEGHMAYGLADYFERVHATDIHDHGSALQHGPPLDFLSPESDRIDQCDWIMTNPPFGTAAEFVEAGLRRAKRGVAVLCRSGWLDTAKRYPFFFAGAAPCDLELAFFDRVAMCLGRWEPRSTEPGGSTATAYSWFVWFQPSVRPGWLTAAQAALRSGLPPRGALFDAPIGAMSAHAIPVIGIPPGTKARLTRLEDLQRFGPKGAAPLLEALDG